jgi:vanillate monooxygenase ferredoxin subunit
MAHRHAAAWGLATVVESVPVTPTVRRIVLDIPGTGDEPRALAGAHLDLAVPLPDGTMTRSYSIVDDGRHRAGISIAVRRVPDSRGGSAFMHGLRPGDSVPVSQPLQSFELTSRRIPCALLAGGIGITPLISMARVLRSRGQSYQLHYSGRSASDMPFQAELEHDHPGCVHFYAGDLGQRIDVGRFVKQLDPDTELYVCGPPTLLAAVTGAWAADGRRPGRLRFESFGSGGNLAAVPFEIRVPRLGISTMVPADTTAAAALQGAGGEVLTDCLRGECGLCVVPVLALDGRLDHRDVFLSQRQKNLDNAMALCVSRVAGGSVCVDLPRRPAA